MKTKKIVVGSLTLLSVSSIWAQGTLTFVYDQQSATAATVSEGGTANLQTSQPFGQSFTPSLSTVGFVQLDVFTGTAPVSMAVNLMSGSIIGPILGTSEPMIVSANFDGMPDFIFQTPVSVTPGTVYYFQPVLISGNTGIGGELIFNYPGGAEILQGTPAEDGRDLWFREGIVAPEPSTLALLLVSGGALAFGWRRR